MPAGKNILLGVCGSIAAYKAAILIRLLVKSGSQVKVVMTKTAAEFISPLTLSTLSKNPVFIEFTKESEGRWNNHVELGLWADLMVMAPASANTMAKCSHGICDNLLSAVYLSARCPVWWAPAMDLDMYRHPSTQENLQRLRQYGNLVIDAKEGELASGLSGVGRMAEPEDLFQQISSYFNFTNSLQGKTAVVTAGPTYEEIDPVRYIGNHSTGKMGYEIATILAEAGAEVTLISGPSVLSIAHPKIQLIKVGNAAEMYEATEKEFPGCQLAVFAAAVADYTPTEPSTEKLKKSGGRIDLSLKRTRDIALEMGKIKKDDQITVGFALETKDEAQNAFDKLQAKNFDLIVLNSLNDQGAGFAHDTNKITLFDKHNNATEFELKSKKEVARDIVRKILELY